MGEGRRLLWGSCRVAGWWWIAAAFLVGVVAIDPAPGWSQARPPAAPASSGSPAPGAEVHRSGAGTLARPVRLHHINVQGDLDNLAIARELLEQFSAAQQQIERAARGTPGVEGMVILQLDAHRWRADVIDSVIDAILGRRVRVVALLADHTDRRIGAGTLAIGLACDEVYIDPVTTFQSLPHDNASELAPQGSDTSERDDRLSRRLRPLIARRAADPLVGEAILGARTPLWLAEDESGVPRLTPAPPEPSLDPSTSQVSPANPARATKRVSAPLAVVVREPLGPGYRTTLAASSLLRLGVVSGVADTVGRVLASDRASASSITRSRVSNRLDAAARDVRLRLVAVDAELDAAEGALRKPPAYTSRTQSDASRSARALRRAANLVAGVRQKFADVNAKIAEFPELLQTRPPGPGDVVAPPDKWATQWRTQLKKRHDRCERLESRVRQLLPP